MTLVLLAGGLSTRLRPMTLNIPKAMIKICDEPFISHQLKLFKRENIKNVIICVGFLGEQIVDFVGDGKKFGLNVSFSFDGDKLLGTGGSIKKALPKIMDENFFVMYGDSYLDIEFAPIMNFFNEHKKSGLMTVIKNDDKWDKSNVVYTDSRIILYNKRNRTQDMHFIDYGLGILKKSVFNDWEENKNFGLDEVYEKLVSKNELLGYEIYKRFYEIGSFEGIKETEEYIKKSTKF
jgi:N-acetyl-alpha-D-muramate 1-phosphate uridylyltransferase